MKQERVTKALIAAYNLIEYAMDKNAYVMRGGDHYIETSLVKDVLCEALGLDYKTATYAQVNVKIKEFESETK